MTTCKTCHHPCHCQQDLHADEYGICTCDECNCKKTYKKRKDYDTDMSYENEVRKSNGD